MPRRGPGSSTRGYPRTSSTTGVDEGPVHPVPDGRAEDDRSPWTTREARWSSTASSVAPTPAKGPRPQPANLQRIPSTTFPSNTGEIRHSRKSGTTGHRCTVGWVCTTTNYDAPIVDLDLQRLIGSESASRRSLGRGCVGSGCPRAQRWDEPRLPVQSEVVQPVGILPAVISRQPMLCQGIVVVNAGGPRRSPARVSNGRWVYLMARYWLPCPSSQ